LDSRQIFEVEKKNRLLSTIEFPMFGGNKITVTDFVDEEIFTGSSTASTVTFSGELNVTQADLDNATTSVCLLLGSGNKSDVVNFY
jgi:hypothetical protein